MKFIKTLLTIPFAGIVGWLIQSLFIWLIPIAMNISWGWFIVYLLLAGGFISLGIGAVVTIIAMPNAWLTYRNKMAKFVASAIYAASGIYTVLIPWGNGISSFGVLRWIVAISLTITIILTYGGLIGAMFSAEETDDPNYSLQ